MCSLGFAEPSAAYTSATQQARHLTEGWMAEHGFCPACPADRLPPLPNNTRVGDFRCAACGEEYELKQMPVPSPLAGEGGSRRLTDEESRQR